MRQTAQDTPVNFRMNAKLLAAVQAKAEQEGMSVSELMRHALRREVRGRA